MATIYEDPGPEPGPDAPKSEREAWRKANEAFLMEGHNRGHNRGRKRALVTPEQHDKAVERDHQTFMDKRSPFTAALWATLLRPISDTLFDVEMARRYKRALEMGDPDSSGYIQPRQSGLLAITQRLVAAGADGDTSALSQIQERIEGKVGLRRGDMDPDDPARQKQTQQITENLLAVLTERRIGASAAKEIEAHVTVDSGPRSEHSTPSPLRSDGGNDVSDTR